MTNSSKHKITVIGSGYVGMSLAVLLSQKHNVEVVDIDEDKIKKINLGVSPISDLLISDYLENKALNLKATSSLQSAITSTNIAIIATPTDYDDKTKKFDTTSVDETVNRIIKINKEALIIIKSTIPEGHTEKLKSIHKTGKIIFSPEFLREGLALHDNLYPSRIIVGSKCDNARLFASLLKQASHLPEVEILYTSSREAEAIKLFSNSYLALRVAFFNELDTYAMSKNLNSEEIIRGLSLDSRIGDHYNNPSFGYGGYCLPKDTKQLLSNFKDIPQDLIKSVIASNYKRKVFIANKIMDTDCKTIGFYKLAMKKGSDNLRSSSILDVINLVKTSDKKIIVFEPSIKNNFLNDIELEENLEIFKSRSDLIVTNRYEEELLDVLEKVFTRDIFKEN
jgi:UDPglucose 6-dehydrogenase